MFDCRSNGRYGFKTKRIEMDPYQPNQMQSPIVRHNIECKPFSIMCLSIGTYFLAKLIFLIYNAGDSVQVFFENP